MCHYGRDVEATKRLILKTYGLAEDIISDPTLPRSRDEIECGECGHYEAVFFQVGNLAIFSGGVRL